MLRELFLIRLLSGWDRTPRTTFARNENYTIVCYTDPPIRGVQFHMQTLHSFVASKARGVLHHPATPEVTWQIF
jgi:hypothetical protein